VRDIARAPTLGLRANWRQFWLLVLVNAFVGAMVGLERTVLPLIAEQDFGLASKSAVLSFIATFGLAKALSNLLTGRLADRVGRRRLLIGGWLIGAPVPLLVMWAPSWAWIVVANVLLGVNQGLAWSTTVIMKIDLVGGAQRGFAMGLNEFAGYLAVALSALASGYVAGRFGLRPEPFYLGIAFVALGLIISLVFVRDTTAHVLYERAAHAGGGTTAAPSVLPAQAVRDGRKQVLFHANQAGLVTNLNDGLAWGLFPLLFAGGGLSLRAIGVLAFAYPATWGIAQLATGALSDRVGRKRFIGPGMLVQGAALLAIAFADSFRFWLLGSVALGLGTAMAYPTLLAAVGDVSPPASRGANVGAYRFWRDLGYVAGALLAGAIADVFSLTVAIAAVGWLTFGSGVLVVFRMPETLPAYSNASQHAGASVAVSRR
jgi:MFS family permease